jgi:hypothetical protein
VAAIGPENVLKKLCFALHGEVSESALKNLRGRLARSARELRQVGRSAISRQAIHQLFQGAIPSRDGTYQFLNQFVQDVTKDAQEYSQLSNERKIVLSQIDTFCRRQQRAEVDLEIHATSSGHVVIRQERIYPPRQYAEEADYYVGTYRVFKKRLSNDSEEPISREFMQIYKRGQYLHVRWWILLDELKVAAYEGALVFVGTAMWAILHNPSLGGRIRVFNATKTGWGRTRPEFHTGVLLSTTPHYLDPSPSACRVFIERIKPITEEKIRRELKHISLRQFSHPHRELVMRVITNEHMSNGRLDALDHLLRPKR